MARTVLCSLAMPNQIIESLDIHSLVTATGGINWGQILQPNPSPLPHPAPRPPWLPAPSPLPRPWPSPLPNPFPQPGQPNPWILNAKR